MVRSENSDSCSSYVYSVHLSAITANKLIFHLAFTQNSNHIFRVRQSTFSTISIAGNFDSK